MGIAVTGATGFIGKNLVLRLREAGHDTICLLDHKAHVKELTAQLRDIEFVFHLAGVNRSQDPVEFELGNVGFTDRLVEAMGKMVKPPRIAFTSSTQAAMENQYGRSKREAENLLEQYSISSKSPLYLLRLTNVFGKWCRPNYNSVVATFCHNIARGIPLIINDPKVTLQLIYIDDVVDTLLKLPHRTGAMNENVEVNPVFETTVGEVASILQGFQRSRKNLYTMQVGTGLLRALYATYLSYSLSDSFAYHVPVNRDARGIFVEMLRTPECGQFSYFTAHPGVTRGEHYHHSKAEKFLVVKGIARFAFRHVYTDEMQELIVHEGEGRIVETIPGWVHNVTNIGKDELIAMLWASEVFDRERPDTIAMKVET